MYKNIPCETKMEKGETSLQYQKKSDCHAINWTRKKQDMVYHIINIIHTRIVKEEDHKNA